VILGLEEDLLMDDTPASDLSRIVLALSRTHAAGLTGGRVDIDAFIRLII
jgi:hypothetical protein